VHRRTIIAAGAALFLTALTTSVLRAEQGESQNDDESRVQTGLSYAKTQGINLDLKGRNRGLVGLGSYLVNAAGACNECHTAPPYLSPSPFAFLGAPKQVNINCYLAGGVAFGPFVSRDITPWENGKPAGLTFDQFVHVMRTGEDPDNPGQVLQVMPWPAYGEMTDRDLRAVYEYLSAIPAINANVCGVPSE